MLRTSLCEYGDAYILIKENLSVNTAAAGADANNTNKKVLVKIDV